MFGKSNPEPAVMPELVVVKPRAIEGTPPQQVPTRHGSRDPTPEEYAAQLEPICELRWPDGSRTRVPAPVEVVTTTGIRRRMTTPEYMTWLKELGYMDRGTGELPPVESNPGHADWQRQVGRGADVRMRVNAGLNPDGSPRE